MPHADSLQPTDPFRHHTLQVIEAGVRYHTDEAFRRSVAENPRDALGEMGMSLPDAVDVKVVVNTDDVAYFVLPADPNMELTDEALETVAGGDTAGSASTISTFSTTPGSTVGTICCAGTAGSA